MLKFYFDEMMPRSVPRQLAEQNIETIRAVEAGMEGKTDPQHLKFATEQGAVLVTFDRPFAGLTTQKTDHAGLICWTGANSDIGGMVNSLTQFAKTYTSEQVKGKVFWLK